MADLDVEIVAVERELWSGKATFVFTRTTAGEIGILPRHIPLVAQLVDDAVVRVEREARTTCGSPSTVASCRSPRPA
jgi:F-type H+-transporting ATPase subunit epsilon